MWAHASDAGARQAWFQYFKSCWALGIFKPSSHWSLHGMVQKKPFDKWQFLNEHSIQAWWAEKHPRTHNMPNLEADELQQQKTRWVLVLSAKDRKLKPIIGTSSTKLYSWRLKKKKKKSLLNHESWFLLQQAEAQNLALASWIHVSNLPCVIISGWWWRCTGVGSL